MTDPMTPAALAEIAARAQTVGNPFIYDIGGDDKRKLARTDIPRLLAEVERLAAENARLKNEAELFDMVRDGQTGLCITKKQMEHAVSCECMVCAVAICGEPLHFHHDGCPECAVKQQKIEDRNTELEAENARLRDAERTLPKTKDGHPFGIGSHVWRQYEFDPGDVEWWLIRVSAIACTQDGALWWYAGYVINDGPEHEDTDNFLRNAYAYHPETGQSADEARAAIDAAKESKT